MPKVSLVMAMEEESQGIVRALGLERVVPRERYQTLPFIFYRGRYQGLELTLTLPGKDPRVGMDNIGTEPAAVATFATVMEFAPDLLINAGTAGSFRASGAEVGRVYLSESAFFFHDHRIPIKGWDEFGRGRYPSLDVRKLATKLGLATANVSSGNSLDFTDEDLRILKANGATLKEMEVGAVAWVAFTTGTPLFAIKSVTNLIDVSPDSPTEFEKNFPVAVASLTRETVRVLSEIAGLDLPAVLARNSI